MVGSRFVRKKKYLFFNRIIEYFRFRGFFIELDDTGGTFGVGSISCNGECGNDAEDKSVVEEVHCLLGDWE